MGVLVVIEVSRVSKTYHSKKVLDDVSLKIKEGDYFAFLGENGSGKSTLIAILLGLVPPDRGAAIQLFGEPAGNDRGRILRKKIGVVGEAAQLNDDRSVWTYLEFYALLYGLENRHETIALRLDDVGLFEAREKKIKTLSRGMKQRLALARALLHNPALLILDEPVNGLDPRGIHNIRQLLERENQKGTTIFLCSHLLSEVEKSCTQAGIIHKGRIQICGPMSKVADGNLEAAYLRYTSETIPENDTVWKTGIREIHEK
jgi:ABC-2 type transport system ATP-binding protein